MSAIAVLGTGAVGRSLAAGWHRAGHDVTVGSRRARSAEYADLADASIRVADHAAAVDGAAVVVNALPGPVGPEILGALDARLAGAVVLDVSNDAPDAERPPVSIAETLARLLPRASVVKALNTVPGPLMTAPGLLATPPTAFVATDDPAARSVVDALLVDLGWDRTWIADVGGLTRARALESLIDLVPALFARSGGRPFAFGVVT